MKNKKAMKFLLIAVPAVLFLSAVIVVWSQLDAQPSVPLAQSTPAAPETPAPESKSQVDLSEYTKLDAIVQETNEKVKEPEPNKVVVTEDENGNQSITPEYSKPEPPPPPEIPEEQKKDPSKQPEYTPEDTNKTPKEPTGGEKKDGKIFVPGFGWLEDPGTGSGNVSVGHNSGSGEIIGQ